MLNLSVGWASGSCYSLYYA